MKIDAISLHTPLLNKKTAVSYKSNKINLNSNQIDEFRKPEVIIPANSRRYEKINRQISETYNDSVLNGKAASELLLKNYRELISSVLFFASDFSNIKFDDVDVSFADDTRDGTKIMQVKVNSINDTSLVKFYPQSISNGVPKIKRIYEMCSLDDEGLNAQTVYDYDKEGNLKALYFDYKLVNGDNEIDNIENAELLIRFIDEKNSFMESCYNKMGDVEMISERYKMKGDKPTRIQENYSYQDGLCDNEYGIDDNIGIYRIK